MCWGHHEESNGETLNTSCTRPVHPPSPSRYEREREIKIKMDIVRQSPRIVVTLVTKHCVKVHGVRECGQSLLKIYRTVSEYAAFRAHIQSSRGRSLTTNKLRDKWINASGEIYVDHVRIGYEAPRMAFSGTIRTMRSPQLVRSIESCI